MHKYNLITPPAIEIPTLTEIKAQRNITHDEDDAILELYRSAAIKKFERDTGRTLINATWTLNLDRFPCDEILIWKSPVSQVVSVQYVDADGQTQTLSTSDYYADTKGLVGRIVPNGSFPATADRPNAVTVTFITGFGADPEDVPADIKLCLLSLVAHWHKTREPVTEQSQNVVPYALQCIVDGYKVLKVGSV